MGIGKQFRVLAGLALLAVSGTVLAQTGSLSFVSEPGDYIGQGQTLSFDASALNVVGSSNGNMVSVSVNTPEHWFYLDMAAPSGTPLAVGVYEGAMRYPFQDFVSPGLSFSGDGRGCNTLTGRFEITELVMTNTGYVEKIKANWEQHCEGMPPALFGQIDFQNAPPPPPLSVDVIVVGATVNRHTGQLTLTGTAQCSSTVSVTLQGSAAQRMNRKTVSIGQFYQGLNCTSTKRNWTATVSSFGAPFNPGQVQVDATTSAFDPVTSNYVTNTQSTVINATR